MFELVTTRREAFAQPWIEDCQWLDRLATQSGKTLLGAEAAQISAVTGWLAGRDDVDPSRIAVVGGREALAAAAIDSRLHVVGDVEHAHGQVLGVDPAAQVHYTAGVVCDESARACFEDVLELAGKNVLGYLRARDRCGAAEAAAY